VIESDWLLTFLNEALIDDVEHFEKRCVRRNVGRFVALELTWGIGAGLSPNFKAKIHGEKSA
jgi:hypothetical protein